MKHGRQLTWCMKLNTFILNGTRGRATHNRDVRCSCWSRDYYPIL